MTSDHLTRRLAARVFTLGLLALPLAACSSGENEPTPSCPQVLILSDAQRFTQFLPGGGRDITDIEAEGEIVGFRGACEYSDDGTVEVTVAVSFDLMRGAAERDGTIDFSYFVAVPDLYPDERGKAVIPVQVTFPGNLSRVRYVDEEVLLTLPISADKAAASYEVILGFQLDPAQLQFNRDRKR